jgi:hypothetical protein
MATIAPVRIEGLQSVHARLKKFQVEAAKDFRKAEGRAAEVVSRAAAAKAPRGHRPLPKNRRLRLHETIKPIVRGTRVYVGALGSQAPHGNVVHWGGTIKPKGTPIHFQRRPFILEAFRETRPEFVRELEMELDKAIREAGFY